VAGVAIERERRLSNAVLDREARRRLAALLALHHGHECLFDVTSQPVGIEQRICRAILRQL